MSIGEIVGLVLGILSILVILAGATAWWVKQTVRNEIAAFTRPIQPGYRNGGQSLADVAYRLERLERHFGVQES